MHGPRFSMTPRFFTLWIIAVYPLFSSFLFQFLRPTATFLLDKQEVSSQDTLRDRNTLKQLSIQIRTEVQYPRITKQNVQFPRTFDRDR